MGLTSYDTPIDMGRLKQMLENGELSTTRASWKQVNRQRKRILTLQLQCLDTVAEMESVYSITRAHASKELATDTTEVCSRCRKTPFVRGMVIEECWKGGNVAKASQD